VGQKGQDKSRDYNCFYKNDNENLQLGTGFLE
jgi:hypothetical protein